MTKIYLANDKGITNDPFFQEFNFLYKNAFDSNFHPFGKAIKMPYPIDAWFNDEFYAFEIPIVKGKIEDVTITKEGDLLRIKYVRSNKDTGEKTFVKQGIVQRDFDMQWKIPSKFDKNKISSTFENGLLSIFIPFAEAEKPEVINVINVNENWKKVAQGDAL